MKAVLDFPSEQDETILSYYDSYGVYYHYDDHVNQREDYISVKENGSNEFYITFDIPREDFSCDYNNFVATCANKITFKTYTIDGWGIKEFYDEQEPKIIYEQKPSLTFTSAEITGTNVTNVENVDDDERITYETTYDFSFDILGTFWISSLQMVLGGGWNNLWEPLNVSQDGTYNWGRLSENSDAG